MRAMSAVAFLLSGVCFVTAAEPAVSLKLIAKKDSYGWPVAQKPAEFEASLKEAQKAIKEMKEAIVPKPFLVDFVLRFTNTGKETVDIFVNGDANTLTLELSGPGVVTLAPPKAFTAEFRMPKRVSLEAGKSFDMPVGQLSDGFRGASRMLFFTAPGDYTLKARYQLADAEGKKTDLLQAEAVKFKVEPPK